MEQSYAAFIELDDNRFCQLVLCLPQSKIGYTYPEVYVCLKVNDSLRYVHFDFYLSKMTFSDEKTFMQYYVYSPKLTDEIFRSIQLFPMSLNEFTNVLYDEIKQYVEVYNAKNNT